MVTQLLANSNEMRRNQQRSMGDGAPLILRLLAITWLTLHGASLIESLDSPESPQQSVAGQNKLEPVRSSKHATGWPQRHEQVQMQMQMPSATSAPDDEPIVIHSVHSGNAQPVAVAATPKRPSNSPAHRTQQSADLSLLQLQQMQAQALDDKQEARSSSHLGFGNSNYHTGHNQQPSQDFEPQPVAATAWGANPARWPLRQQDGGAIGGHLAQASSPPRDHHLGLSGAPYAVAQQAHTQPPQQQRGWTKEQQHQSAGGSHQMGGSHTLGSLIRDTSELQASNVIVGGSELQHQQPLSSDHQHLNQAVWMQSVRDNHHGPLRSRFNLTLNGPVLSEMRNNNYPLLMSVGGGLNGGATAALLSNGGHMKQSSGVDGGPAAPPVAHEQQASKLAREQQPASSTPTDSQQQQSIWSRRNSKFTRQNESPPPTTPVSAPLAVGWDHSGPKVTANQHRAPPSSDSMAARRAQVSHIGGSSASVSNAAVAASSPSSTTMAPAAGADEIATGIGVNAAAGEADSQHQLLSQRFDTDSELLGGEKKPPRNQQVAGEQASVVDITTTEKPLSSQQEEMKLANGTMATKSNGTTPSEPQILLNNNHSDRGRTTVNYPAPGQTKVLPKVAGAGGSSLATKAGRKLALHEGQDEEEKPQASQQLRQEARLADGGILSKSSNAQQAASGSRSWSRLLPNLLQRTLGSVLRRLTGSQQQPSGASSSASKQQHPAPQQVPATQALHTNPALMANFGAGGGAFAPAQSAGLSFLSSALTAAAAVASRPVKPSPHSALIGAVSNLADQMDAAGHLGLSKQQATAANNLHESRQPLRQHANKKIIDSLIDLPVSERRLLSSDRREDDDEEQQEVASSMLDDGHVRLEPQTRRKQAKRSSKTGSEWKTSHDMEGDYEAESESRSAVGADDSEGIVVADSSDQQEPAAQPEVGASVHDKDLLEESESELQLDFRTSTSAGIDYDESDSVEDTTDPNEVRLYSAAHDLGELPVQVTAANRWQYDLPSDSESNSESANLNYEPSAHSYPSIGEDKQPTDERQRQSSLLLYSPNSELSLPPTIMGGHQTGATSEMRGLKAPELRRVQLAPIEGYDEQQQQAEPKNAESRRKPTRRRPTLPKRHRPSPQAPSAPAAGTKPQVPPISLQSTRPFGLGGAGAIRHQQSAAPKPLSVFAAPHVAAADTSKAMLSPMSSSINVMDLDPSMTQLAHNKLIVAKYKPKKYKLKNQLAARRPSSSHASSSTTPGTILEPPAATTPNTPSAARTSARPQLSVVRRTSLGTKAPSLFTLTKTRRPDLSLVTAAASSAASAGASFASALLGSQVITNNHINDILSRWTRAPSSSPRPALVAGHTTSNGLRIMSDIRANSQAAQGLVARFSLAANQSPGANSTTDTSNSETTISPAGISTSTPTSTSSSTTTTTTTTTTLAPSQAPTSRPSDHYANAWSSGQYAASSAAGYSGNKNDKFNFSLISMNNRERINPLLFPTESQRPPAVNVTQSKKHSNQRFRLTTTTTTTSTTSTTSTTTSSPKLGQHHSSNKPHHRVPAGVLGDSSIMRPINNHRNHSNNYDAHRAPHSTQAPHPVRRPPMPTQQAVSHRPRPPTPSAHPPFAPAIESADADDEVGQILRNQHHTRPAPRPAPRPPLTEAQRLKNQYLSLIGHNVSLDGRRAGLLISDQAPSDQHLSGHISLVSTNLFANDQNVGYTTAHNALEEAAHDANKYVTVGLHDHERNSAMDNDHSIVIMSDNHHQTRRRRPPPVDSSQFQGRNQSPAVNIPSAPPNGDSLSSAQIARKYLEEFVNGSRIRPSSAAKLGQVLESMMVSNQSLSAFNTDHVDSSISESPITIYTSNHSPPLSTNGNSSNGDSLRRFGISHQAQELQSTAQNQPQVSNSAKGSPLPEFEGINGKLDDRAQELLQDVFDGDPSYTNSLFAASESNAATNNKFLAKRVPSSSNINNNTEISRRIYSQEDLAAASSSIGNSRPTTLSDEAITHYTMSEGLFDGSRASTTDSRLNSGSSQTAPAPEYSVDIRAEQPATSSTDLKESTSGVELETTTTTTAPINAAQNDYEETHKIAYDNNRFGGTGIGQMHRNGMKPLNGEHNDNRFGSSARGTDSAESNNNLNNRVSMRKNQAMIQSILMAIARKNANLTTTTGRPISEPDSEEHEPASDPDSGTNYWYQSTSDSSANTPAITSATTTLSVTSTTMSTPTTTSTDELESGTMAADMMDQEITSFYAPQKLTTVSSVGSQSAGTTVRYPTVETVSATRQKINRPTPEAIDYPFIFSTQFMTSTPAAPQPTTKITESPDEALRAAIKNRLASGPAHATKTTTEMPTEIDGGPTESILVTVEATEPEPSDGTSFVVETGTMNVRRPTASSASPPNRGNEPDLSDQEPGASSELEYPPLAIEGYPLQTNQAPRRPVLIRRKPRPPTRRPTTGHHQQKRPHPGYHQQQQQHHHQLVNQDPQRPAQGGQKRRRKPVKRPTSIADSLDSIYSEGSNRQQLANSSISVPQQQQAASVESGSTLTFDSPFKDPKPNRNVPLLIRRPVSRPSGIIRKRPTYVRLPAPEKIRIHEYRNQTRRPQVSIILPMDSMVKRRPDQDIRTRPLTIIDPAQDYSGAATNDSINDSALVNPFGLTRIPETTIVHNKMVVTYKPGRPLPGSMSSFNQINSDLPNRRTEYDNSSSLATSTMAPEGQEPTTTDSSSSLLVHRPQLGSGNGGDTHLISIEQQLQQQQQQQQQQQMHTTNRPNESSSSSSHAGEIASTTPYPHRPIIVINGPFDTGNHGSSSSDGPKFSAHHHKPKHPASGHSLVEASSMSVMAQASHGHSNIANSSRPWYPTSGSTLTNLSPVGRHNVTSSNSTISSTNENTDSSNQTADSVVGPDLPIFGGSSPSSSWTGASGSYSNHHQQSQHIGMPYLGPGGGLSSSSNSRPGAQRPYRWRVKKRPNGNSSSGSSSSGPHYEPTGSASSSHSSLFRPSGGHLFNLNSMGTLLDNLRIVFARFRTLIISLMVMFLPPLALAASVANAMSS